MLIRTDLDIISLIACEKQILKKPSPFSEKNRNITQRFSVYSVEKDEEFKVFFSYSSKMPKDFSLGLLYKDYLLFRCNGFHGTTKAGFYNHKHHAYQHSHTLTVVDIEKKCGVYPSNISDMRDKYVDINTAILYFFNRCSIINYEEYFDLNQIVFDGF